MSVLIRCYHSRSRWIYDEYGGHRSEEMSFNVYDWDAFDGIRETFLEGDWYDGELSDNELDNLITYVKQEFSICRAWNWDLHQEYYIVDLPPYTANSHIKCFLEEDDFKIEVKGRQVPAKKATVYTYLKAMFETLEWKDHYDELLERERGEENANKNS